MKYMGSKNRHAKELLEIILDSRKENQIYTEPFVGGFNVIDKVPGERVANDSHPYLISLFQAIRDGWVPPSKVSEEEYKYRKNNPREDMALTGFVGFGCSYSGKWFGGYARGGNDSKGNPRNYALESKKNLLKQAPNLKDIQMFCYNYYDLYIDQDSLIYCDPPYENTTKYKDNFDHVKFWDWVRNKTLDGHSVFVSEYNAPDDFETLWHKKVNNTLVKDTGSKTGIEKLFKMKVKAWA